MRNPNFVLSPRPTPQFLLLLLLLLLPLSHGPSLSHSPSAICFPISLSLLKNTAARSTPSSRAARFLPGDVAVAVRRHGESRPLLSPPPSSLALQERTAALFSLLLRPLRSTPSSPATSPCVGHGASPNSPSSPPFYPYLSISLTLSLNFSDTHTTRTPNGVLLLPHSGRRHQANAVVASSFLSSLPSSLSSLFCSGRQPPICRPSLLLCSSLSLNATAAAGNPRRRVQLSSMSCSGRRQQPKRRRRLLNSLSTSPLLRATRAKHSVASLISLLKLTTIAKVAVVAAAPPLLLPQLPNSHIKANTSSVLEFYPKDMYIFVQLQFYFILFFFLTHKYTYISFDYRSIFTARTP